MKTLRRLLFGVCLTTACIATASAEFTSVPFVTGRQQFKAGDGIVIDQVLATSPKLGIGTKVVVRGHYQLSSANEARLGLFVTHEGRSSDVDSVTPSQTARVSNATGAFELSCAISEAGSLHVSFYPVPTGEAFGGVYFRQE